MCLGACDEVHPIFPTRQKRWQPECVQREREHVVVLPGCYILTTIVVGGEGDHLCNACKGGLRGTSSIQGPVVPAADW